jgi:hypothetical protein
MKVSQYNFDINNVFQPPISGINPQIFIDNLSNSSNDLVSVYYNKDEGNILMKKINKLNMNFYMLSERYLKHRNDLEKINDSLFLNLFKQISVYIEEIEKLNLKIKDKGNNSKINKNNLVDLNKEIIDCKLRIRNLEYQLSEKYNNEIKLKKEIESYKRQLIFYKDKLKIDLINHKLNETKRTLTNTKFVPVKKINYHHNKTANNSMEKESSFENNDNEKITSRNNRLSSYDKINTSSILKKKKLNKFINNNQNNNKKEFIQKIQRNNLIKSNLSFSNEVNNTLNISKFSINDNLTVDDKNNKNLEDKNLSLSPNKKINKEKEIKKNNHTNSVQINIGNINNIHNSNFETIVNDVNDDYDKNIAMLKERELQIKMILNLMKGNKNFKSENNNYIKDEKKKNSQNKNI